MNKIIARKIALHLAVFQLFSGATLFYPTEINAYTLENESHSGEIFIPEVNMDNIVLITDEDGKKRYQRIDKETGEYRDISIFDYENIATRQYGANQNVFYDRFSVLIRDPLIMEEIQKMFPYNEIDKDLDPFIFYRFYLDYIRKAGCGFAAGVNAIFNLYEGQEDEFFETFGFPMYYVSSNYMVNFNYEIMMLTYYNKYIKKKFKIEEFKNSIEREAYKYLLKHYKDQRKELKKANQDHKNWSDASQLLKWKEKDQELEELIEKINNKLNEIPENNNIYALRIEDIKSSITDFLSTYRAKAKITTNDNLKNPNVGDILACGKSYIYTGNDKFYSIYPADEVGPHCHTISEIETDESGKKIITVSSWGLRYKIDIDKTKVLKRCTIK